MDVIQSLKENLLEKLGAPCSVSIHQNSDKYYFLLDKSDTASDHSKIESKLQKNYCVFIYGPSVQLLDEIEFAIKKTIHFLFYFFNYQNKKLVCFHSSVFSDTLDFNILLGSWWRKLRVQYSQRIEEKK